MKEGSDPQEETTDPLDLENAIFETAMQIADPARRREFLDRTFQGDPAGRQGMEELLDMAGTSSAFFLESRLNAAELAREVIEELPDCEEPPAEAPDSHGEREGSTIGRYTLLRKIGEGGGGEIFEAAQDGMMRTVALKIVRSGMDTEAVVSRFEAERQALELMEHPNIARVLDAGRTFRGRPYFVMELVRGTRITSFCEAGRLDIRQRLELFLKVCQVIQHAHQKGIVHRDIKPSNILVEDVDGIPVPKVIDFGIAKAMQGASRGRAGITQVGQLIGTPAYMSPEQIDMGGMDIDTRADIYGLGALLYEMLAGRAPFDTEKLLERGMTEMRRVLIEDNPPLPSEAVRQAGKATVLPGPGEKWANAIRGDLDWIVFKAMEKERNRRYQTANSLAMDIRRYLRNEPVIARKPSRGYFMRKFFQRNRATCVLGAAMLLSLLAGLGTTTVLYFREKDALAEQARLKRQAQARANVSHAAILLSEGNTEEADRLLRKDPLESIDASPEAAEVFRSLGRWNAVIGRWRQAAECFRLMNEANRLGDRAKIAEGLDLLMTAPVYLEAGDRKAYEEFRAEVLDRYMPVESGLQAEHILKVCLLTPADRGILERLESAARVCRENPRAKSGLPGLPEWNALSLSLFHYRKDEFREAIRAAETCLGFADKAGSRAAAARCLLAMAMHKLGETGEARGQLDKANAEIYRVESQVDGAGSPTSGTWFAWSVVRILAREADGMMGGL